MKFNIYLLNIFVFHTLEGSTQKFFNLNPIGSTHSQCFDLKSEPYNNVGNSKFGPFIEGVGVDKYGSIYAVNYGNNSTKYQLGQISESQKLFYSDKKLNSWLNGIRFVNGDLAYVADAVNHRVLALRLKRGKVIDSKVFCEDNSMLQPNDLAVTSTGLVFTSGMKFVENTNQTHGDVWVCNKPAQNSDIPGKAKKLLSLGRTNGIEVSPCQSYLYVSESHNKNFNPYYQIIWRYNLNPISGDISERKIFANFTSLDGSSMYDIDGMRTDIQGNIYVTRHGHKKVVVFNPHGEMIGQIQLTIFKPTNLEFGGPNGTELFIVGQCPEYHPIEGLGVGCIDKIQLDVPGQAFFELQKFTINSSTFNYNFFNELPHHFMCPNYKLFNIFI